MKRLSIVAAGLVLTVGIVVGAIMGNPFGGKASATGSAAGKPLSGYQVVYSNTTLGPLAPGDIVNGRADCPQGKNVLGGGGNITSPVGNLWISSPNNVGTNWVVSFRIDTGVTAGVELVTWAICADVT